MRFRSLGATKDMQAFRQHLESIDDQIGCVESLSGSAGPMGSPTVIPIAGKRAGNRFAIHPMEGWDGTQDGTPTDHTLRRWRNFGRSGAKLIWGGEAFAVREDGRANPNQLFRNPGADTARGLENLRNEILAGHEEQGLQHHDLVIGLQLTHSGRFARPYGSLQPKRIYAHPVLDQRFGVNPDLPTLTDGELEAIGEDFVEAAKLAQETGFDFVDVKCCHGYLLHECLSARTRNGAYGGDFEGRTKLFRAIVDELRTECPGLAIGVRISISDMYPFTPHPESRVGEPFGVADHLPYRHGFGLDPNHPQEAELTEPFAFLSLLHERNISLVNVSLGSPYYTPHIQRPAAFPPSDGYVPPEDPLAGVARHLRVVRACKRAFPTMLFVGSGYSYLQDWLPYVAEHEVTEGHVDFVGLGRMVLSYPDMPLDILRGRPLERKRICRTFSDCTTAPRNNMISGCFPLDPYYKQMLEARQVKKLRRSQS